MLELLGGIGRFEMWVRGRKKKKEEVKRVEVEGEIKEGKRWKREKGKIMRKGNLGYR